MKRFFAHQQIESKVPEAYKYWAFISYSHRDKEIVDWLHAALEQYRFPPEVQSADHSPLTSSLYPIFRDRDELPSSADLGEHLHQALLNSRFLVVVCSPDSAKSAWVNEEIKTFKSLGRSHRVLCLIVGGEPNASEMAGRELEECFPPAIRFNVDSHRVVLETRAEPIAADARKDKDGKKLALLKLIAGIAETDFSQLVQRQQQRRIRRLRLLAFFMSALVIVFAFLTWQAVSARAQVEILYRAALSRQLAHFGEAPTNGAQNVATSLLIGAIQAHLVAPTMEANGSMLRGLVRTENIASILHLTAASSAVTYSPDGKRLASANWDGSISLASLGELSVRQGATTAHQDKVLAISFSPDGKQILSGGVDQEIQRWDAHTGKPIGDKIKGHMGWVSGLAYTKDGKQFLSTSWDGKLKLWDAQTARPVADLISGNTPLTSLTLSPDGTLIAVAGDAEEICIFNLLDHTQRKLRKAEGGVLSIVFSPDGQKLALAGTDKKITMIDLRSSSAKATSFEAHDEGITSIAFSHDGKKLASASWDKSIRIWDTATLAQIGTSLLGHGAQVTSVSFGADDTHLVSSSLDGTLIIWKISNQAVLADVRHPHHTEIRQLANSRDGGLMASVASDGGIQMWDFHNKRILGAAIQLSGPNVYSAAFSPDKRLLALGASDGIIHLWDIKEKKWLATKLAAHQGGVLSVDFNADGSLLASGGWDTSVKLWDMKTKTLQTPSLQNHEGQVSSVKFSPNGKLLASGGDDEAILLWDLSQKTRPRRALRGHKGMVTALAFSHDGAQLASASEDETVMVWNVNQARPHGGLIRANASITSLSFDWQAERLAIGTSNGEVSLWDLASRRMIGDPLSAHQAKVSSLMFSQDGKTLVSSGYDKMLIFWNLDQDDWRSRLCALANRNLSKEEWATTIGSYLPYAPSCPLKSEETTLLRNH